MLSVCGDTYSLTILIVIQQPRTLASMLILPRLIVPWSVCISRRQSCSKAARTSWPSLISGVNRRRGVVCRRGRLTRDIQRLGRRSLTGIRRHFLRRSEIDRQLLASSSVIERRKDGSEDDSESGPPALFRQPQVPPA